MAELSTKPYLLRAIYEWCADNGYTPYIAVAVDERTVVPREYVRNGEIVLNVSATATNRLLIGNDMIEFQARFGGVPRELSIPIEQVSAIYARENGHGMAFDVPKPPAVVEPAPAGAESQEPPPGPRAVPRRSGAGTLSAVPSGSATEPATEPPAVDTPVATRDGNGQGGDAGTRERRPRPAPLPAPQAPVEHSGSTPSDGSSGDAPGSGPGKPGRPRLTRVK